MCFIIITFFALQKSQMMITNGIITKLFQKNMWIGKEGSSKT